jgi:hypothetical protein
MKSCWPSTGLPAGGFTLTAVCAKTPAAVPQEKKKNKSHHAQRIGDRTDQQTLIATCPA